MRANSAVARRSACEDAGSSRVAEGGASAQDEARDLLELVGVEPGAVLLAAVDDHSGRLAEVATLHEPHADRALPILDFLGRRVGSRDARLQRQQAGEVRVATRLDGSGDQQIEVVACRPEAVASGALVDPDAADLLRRHQEVAGGAGQLEAVYPDRLGAEGDAAGGAEARSFGTTGVALGADQAELARIPDDRGAAVATGLGVRADDRSAGPATEDGRVDRLERLVLERLPQRQEKALADTSLTSYCVWQVEQAISLNPRPPRGGLASRALPGAYRDRFEPTLGTPGG